MEANQPKYNLIVILGGPASGKGSLCTYLSQNFDNLCHVSTGDLLRLAKDLDPQFANLMKNGTLLPTSFIGNLIASHIKETCNTNQTVLLDGFPRSKENYDYLCTQMSEFFNVIGVLVIDCSEKIMLHRALGRCEGRTDDTIETCKKRIKIYHEVTEKIIDLFDKDLVKRVDGSSDDRLSIYKKVVDLFGFSQ